MASGQPSRAFVRSFTDFLLYIPSWLLHKVAIMALRQAPASAGSLPPFLIEAPLAMLHTPMFETGIKDPFTVEASHMTLSHNSLIRGFNSIYQQAPRLSPSDRNDFIGYALAWNDCVEKHHLYEETLFFPAIEEATGVKGLMDGELEQHASFQHGMDNFKGYLTQVSRHDSEFSHQKLLHIMDAFSGPLYSHLKSEPQSLLAIKKYSTPQKPIDLAAIALEAGKKSTTAGFVFNTLPVFLLNMETVEFEGEIWHGVFPPISGAMKWLMTQGIPLWHRARLRFTSCGPDGKLKRLAV